MPVHAPRPDCHGTGGKLARHAVSMQCSPAGLMLALAMIVASYLSIRYHAGILAALRVTAALALASAGLGLLAWVTVGLSGKSARTAASEPASVPEPVSPAVSMAASPVIPEPAPMTLITRDGRTLVLSEPGPFVTTPEARS